MIVQIGPYFMGKRIKNNFPMSTHIWSGYILAIIQSMFKAQIAPDYFYYR